MNGPVVMTIPSTIMLQKNEATITTQPQPPSGGTTTVAVGGSNFIISFSLPFPLAGGSTGCVSFVGGLPLFNSGAFCGGIVINRYGFVVLRRTVIEKTIYRKIVSNLNMYFKIYSIK